MCDVTVLYKNGNFMKDAGAGFLIKVMCLRKIVIYFSFAKEEPKECP